MGLASRDTGTFPSRLVSTGTSPQPVLARERSANPFLCPLGAITVSVRLSHAPAGRMKAGTARGPTYVGNPVRASCQPLSTTVPHSDEAWPSITDRAASRTAFGFQCRESQRKVL